MNIVAIFFGICTALFHILFFVVESFFWLNPAVYESVVKNLDINTSASLFEQAQVLESLFFNQGFYNLFIACGAIVGMIYFKSGKTQVGLTLLSYACLMALGAAIVLAVSTQSLAGALIQGAPPLLTMMALLWARQQRTRQRQTL